MGPRNGMDGQKISSPPGFDPEQTVNVFTNMYRLVCIFFPIKYEYKFEICCEILVLCLLTLSCLLALLSM